jgi:hypothetical protein
MSAGDYGVGPGQPDPYSQPGYQQPAPPPPGFGQPSQYGQPVSPQYRYEYGPAVQAPRRTNSLAIAALSCGIGQFIAGPFAGIPAIILGAMSLKQIRETGEDGHGLAVTGLVLGIVGVALFLLLIVAFAGFAAYVVHTGTTGPRTSGTG